MVIYIYTIVWVISKFIIFPERNLVYIQNKWNYIYVYIRIYHRNIFDPYRKRFRDVTCGSSLDTKISILVRPLVTHATLRIYSTSIVIANRRKVQDSKDEHFE